MFSTAIVNSIAGAPRFRPGSSNSGWCVLYNRLNQFAGAGLLREAAIEGSKAYFDTAVSGYQHCCFEHDGRLIDLGPDEEVAVNVCKLPKRTV